MRSIPFGLAAAAVAALIATSAGAAYAQDTRGVPPPKEKEAAAAPVDSAKAKEQGMAEAPALLQQAGVSCAISDAMYKGGGKVEVGKKKVNARFYEVACSDGPGQMITVVEGQTPNVYNCLVMEQAKAQGKSETACELPGNAHPAQGLGPVLARAGVSCTPSQGRWMGASAESKLDMYEVACSEGGAYILQVPQAGSTVKLSAVNCLHGSESVQCTYVTKDQALAQITKMAAPANKPTCQINAARYMGTSTTKTDFYEIGCVDGKSGYVLEVDASGKFLKTINCAIATGIGGGCQLTQVAAGGETIEAPTYTKLAAQIGFQCNVEKYRSLGVDPKGREMVELACAGKPAAMVALLPSDASQKGELWNCARADARGLKCALRPIEATYAAMTQQISAKGKECTVDKTRYVGSNTDTGSDYIEVGCSVPAGGALMMEYGPGMDVVKEVYNCVAAKSIGGGCKFLAK
jgi:hypothetical protein